MYNLLLKIKCISAYNKQIMALAAARWDANTREASPLLQTYLRPIFGS
jgi:hypothetical protein